MQKGLDGRNVPLRDGDPSSDRYPRSDNSGSFGPCAISSTAWSCDRGSVLRRPFAGAAEQAPARDVPLSAAAIAGAMSA